MSAKNRVIHSKGIITLTFLLALMFTLNTGLNSVLASTGVIKSTEVNIRSGPGTNYQRLDTILKGSQVDILETQGDWKHITFGSINGWIASQYIDVFGEIVITGDPVNLRSGPGTNYNAIGQAKKGDKYPLLSQEGDWYHIKTLNGQEAYVAGYLAQITQPLDPTTPVTGTQITAGTNTSGISVVLNGKNLSFQVQPIIEKGRTLVPLRAIFEAMGATLEWNDKTRTATARKGSDVVVLPLNSTQPTVNGKVYPLEVPAKIVKNSTLAPLRFVAEAFGGKADWDGTTRTAMITTVDTSKPVAVTAKAQSVTLRSQPTASSNTVTVSQPGEAMTVLAERDGWYQVSRGGTTAWVASWLVEPTTAADAATLPPSATTDANTNTNMGSPDGSANTNPSGSTAAPPVIAENAVRIAKTTDNTGIKITISSDRDFQPVIKESSGIIQYDIGENPLTGFSAINESMGDGKLSINTINVEQRTIININLPSWCQYTLSTEGNKKYTVSIPNYITSIEKTPFGSVGDRIIVHSIIPISGQSGNLVGDRLEITLPNVAVKSGYSFNCAGSQIADTAVAVSPYNSNDILFTINTINLGRYSFATSGAKKDLNIVLMRKMPVNTGEKIVVLDPGHGGRDAGASGKTLKEKDVNLAVAQKVGALLQQRGIKVEYTRVDDTFMDLSEEVAVANNINASIFVAIHCNSCIVPGPGGTETYFYAPLEKPDLYVQREERQRLATLIQTKMIANLKLTNRGVKDNSALYVLNHTNMPSALVEMAFINNPEEENLLAQEQIRDLAAQAIADAIQEYIQTI